MGKGRATSSPPQSPQATVELSQHRQDTKSCSCHLWPFAVLAASNWFLFVCVLCPVSFSFNAVFLVLVIVSCRDVCFYCLLIITPVTWRPTTSNRPPRTRTQNPTQTDALRSFPHCSNCPGLTHFKWQSSVQKLCTSSMSVRHLFCTLHPSMRFSQSLGRLEAFFSPLLTVA